MIRQPKVDRCYTVEVTEIANNERKGNILCAEPEVYATNPKDAVIFAMKRKGYYVNRDSVISLKSQFKNDRWPVAKVCLIGGSKESVSYFFVVLRNIWTVR